MRKTYKAAVIGATGKGGYGHGLDKVFKGLDGVEFGLAVVFADGVVGGFEEVGAVDAGDFHGVLEGEEDAFAGAFFRFLQVQIPPVGHGKDRCEPFEYLDSSICKGIRS